MEFSILIGTRIKYLKINFSATVFIEQTFTAFSVSYLLGTGVKIEVT